MAVVGFASACAFDLLASGSDTGAVTVALGEVAPSSPGFNWFVLAMTIASFVGAGLAGWRATRRAPVADDGLRLDANLLEPDLPLRPEPRLLSAFGTVLLVVVGVYIVFDRAGAWIHVPSTPLFIGELTIVFGLASTAATRLPMGIAIRKSPSLKALVFWMGWGAVLLLFALQQYGLEAIRDSALWYYGFAALLVVALLVSNPGRLGRWLALYRKVMPYVLVWFPIALVLAVLGDNGPFVPFSEVPLVSHKSGNIAVVTAIYLAYVWLVDSEAKAYTETQRTLITSGGVLVLLLSAVQNRGGMVSAAVGLAIAAVLMRRRRSELGLIMGGVVVVVFTLALVTNVSIPLFGARSVSAQQLITNISSVIDTDAGSSRETSTTEWRLDLWGKVLDDVADDSPIMGFGPGPDLGQIYGISGRGTETLRNPHNSHVGVLARMGFVGVVAWAGVWTVWALQLLLLRQRLSRNGRRSEAALAGWVAVSAFMILLNATFDPTLEGPQVAVVLWVIFGIGAALPLLYSGFESRWLDGAVPEKYGSDIS